MIDAHVHFWNYHPVKDAWIDESMETIRKDFFPQDIEPVFKENEVQGCIAVQADQSEEETLFLLELAEKNDFIKGVVGWVDLQSDDIEEHLKYFSSFEKLKGFRHIAQAEAPGFMLKPSFLNGLKALQDYHFTYDILLGAHQIKDAIALVEKMPNQAFVIDHCCKPNLKSKELSDWQNQIKILAQHRNISCKVSGLITESDWKNWQEKEIFDCLDVVFENFGFDRVLFGSDWPVMLLAGEYQQWINLLKKYSNPFSDINREKFFYQNTQQFYKVK